MISTLLKPSILNAPTLHKLPNGLTIIAEQLPVEAVNLSIWVGVGSAVESAEINGMAHFLEHMVFKGTPQLPSGEFERKVEERGAVTNAATSQDYTQYYITTAPKDFADLAPLQFDVVMNPTIPDQAFERERLVVLEEIRRSEDNPSRRIYQRSIDVAFGKLPYRRPVLGPAEVIEKLTAGQMRDFHSQWYQPSSMTAVAVGNLPVEQLIETVTESFNAKKVRNDFIQDSQLTENSAWDSTFVAYEAQKLIAEPEQPFQEIVRKEYVDDSLQQARLVMVWRVPGFNQLSQTYGLDVLAAILSHGRMSRLVRDLREDRRLVSQIGASNITHLLQGLFYIGAQLPAENLVEVESAIAQHIRNIQTELITKAEIARLQTQVANRFIFSNETPSARAGLYGYYQSMLGDLAPALNYPARIQALDAVALRTAAQRYLSPDAYGVIVSKPSAS
ncbi:MAG: pitrilysin family protein [Crinalium sp.]